MAKYFLIGLLIILAILVTLWRNSNPVATRLPNGAVPTPTLPQSREFTITAQDFSFSPNSLTVNQGDRVTITLNNVGGFHDFNLDEFNVATKQIQANQSDIVTFIADKKGTYEFYCSVGNHRQMGMVGKLIVE